MFNPHLSPGEIIDNRRLMSIFHCACEGGIRYSSKTSTIVLVVNNTKNGRANIWHDGILFFAGRVAKRGAALAGSNRRLEQFLQNGGDVFLFEVNQPGKYEFGGRAALAGEIHLKSTESGEEYPVFPLRLS